MSSLLKALTNNPPSDK